jgi:hypothetical protein
LLAARTKTRAASPLHRIIRIGMTRHDKFRPDNLSHILAR